MKLLLSLLVTLSPVFSAPAPDDYEYNQKFGKVSENEVSLSAYPEDPEAGALYIFDIGEVYLSSKLELVHEVYTRIKIFKKEALELADVRVPYLTLTNSSQRVSDIDANTYNLVNGKLVKTAMPKKNVFKERISDDVSQIKFSIPEAREGSVIEYRYTVTSPSLGDIPDLDIQRDYPVLHSLMEVSLPEFISYNVTTRGLTGIDVEQGDGTFTYNLADHQFLLKRHVARNDNVPALKKEPLVWNVGDYRAGLDLEVSGFTLHIDDIHINERFSHTWEDVNKVLSESRLGEYQKAKNPFRDETKAIAAQNIPDEEKITGILNLVRDKVKYNDVIDLIPDAPGNVAKKGGGSVADMNNLLSLALTDAGFENDLVLLNPRSYGRLPYFPTLQKISSFIVRVKDSEGRFHYLDASDTYSGIDVMSPDFLAQNARIYGKNGPDAWVDLSAIAKNGDRIRIISSLDENGNLKGNYNRVLLNQDAYDFNVKLDKAGSEEKFIEEVIEKGNEITVEDASFEGVGTLNVTERVTFSKEVEKAGDYVYLNPTILRFLSENPFDQQERRLPVEFDVTKDFSMQVMLMVPEGYTIEESPQNIKATACDGDVEFSYLAQKTGNSISARLTMKVGRALFTTEEYEDLRRLFGKVVETCDSKIVIKKN